MARYNGECIYPFIREIQFRILEVSQGFNPESSFSDVDLTLTSIRNVNGDHLYVRLQRLFNFDPDILTFPEKRPPSMYRSTARLVSMLKRCRNRNLEDHLMILKAAAKLSGVTEKIIVLNLVKNLLVPLFGPVDLDTGYQSLVERVGMLGPDVTVTDLGVGAVHTWHGSTEVRVKGCPAIVTLEGLGDSCDENSDGETDDVDIPEHFEGKIRVSNQHFGQLVATCVVNSFTEANLNPGLNPVIPTILFNRSNYRICLYDCENDVLLLSEPKNLTTRGCFSRTGALLLWLTVNHRQFLKPFDSELSKHKSGIREYLCKFNSIQNYLQLTKKNINWAAYRKDYGMDSSPGEELPEPRAKRAKEELPEPRAKRAKR